MSAIIEMRDVSFAYGQDELLALHNLNLSIEEGTFTGVIGPSGAGKTTLASILSGAIPHHHKGRLFGETLVAGIDTCTASLTDISTIVGSVLQDIDAQMVASIVEDELLFGLENYAVPRCDIEPRVAAALDAVGIADLRHREIATLSGGQKQKVAIAAILALAPRVLVLDEPTAALDPISSRTIFDVLREAQRLTNMTIVVIEQMVALLAEYCDRVIVLDEGSIALDGTPRQVFGHADQLRKIGVDSPRTVRISNSIAALQIAEVLRPTLTVDETQELIAGVLAAHPSRSERTGETSSIARAHKIAESAVREEGTVIVDIAGASFSYGHGASGVHDVSLSVRAGEILAIVGQNGAGKTTLTKLLNGLIKPTRGSVRVGGMDTKDTPVSKIAQYASTLFQNPDRQICRNTVLDEVAFGLELNGAPSDEAARRAGRVVERFGLLAHAAPFSLSRGQRQMVALASVVAVEPRLIILDEPTSGLDYRECMTVMETVADCARAGTAVVMVCHDMEVVSDFATTIAVMKEGRVLASGPAEILFGQPDLLRQASVTPPQVVELAMRLSSSVDPSFSGVTEVSDLVSCMKELIDHA